MEVTNQSKIANRGVSDLSDVGENIAIIGMACRFPGGANSPASYWSLLRNGIDAITEVPVSRWDVERYYPGRLSSRYGGFLDSVDCFDAAFFNMAPREALSTDPQQQLLLEVTWEGFEQAGIAPSSLAGTQTGIFTGMFTHDFEFTQVKQNGRLDYDLYFSTGNSASVAAGRIAYFFDLRGPAVAVDTACSSSLTAVHLACQSLRCRECDLAVASAVNLILSPELSIAYSQAGMLAADGRCKTFDASADGYVRSEGCGVLILKPLEAALGDGNRVLAVIRGSAINQDGASEGLTVPNGHSQAAVIRQALARARKKPEDISYIECHGSGTPVGDPIEVTALQQVFGPGRPEGQPLMIGSVKTNIGHTEAVAGIAGVIKVVLSLQHQFIPPNLHFSTSNPKISLDDIPAIVPKIGVPWEKPSENTRLAGVSSFGISGTNGHLIVEEAPVSKASCPNFNAPYQLMVVSAKTKRALRHQVRNYESHLQSCPDDALADICFTTNTGRSHFDNRLTFVAQSVSQLCEEMQAWLAAESQVSASNRSRSTSEKTAFLFGGHGSEYADMGRELFDTQPLFRKSLEHCHEILKDSTDDPLIPTIYPDKGKAAAPAGVSCTPTAIFAVEYALAALWRSWGIVPNGVMGHDVGEFAAACVAGVFSLEEGLKLVAAYARSTGAVSRTGAMASVFAEPDLVTAVIGGDDPNVSIAAVNGPRHIVISGPRKMIESAVERLRKGGIKTRELNLQHAFHSPLMKPVMNDFERVAREIHYSQPDISMIAGATGRATATEIATPDYWINQVIRPVQFYQGITALHDRGYRIFVECGANPTLLGMGRKCIRGNGQTWLPSLRRGQSDWRHLLGSLGALYRLGVPINWAGFYEPYHCRTAAMPTYPFQRRRLRPGHDPSTPARPPATVMSNDGVEVDVLNATDTDPGNRTRLLDRLQESSDDNHRRVLADYLNERVIRVLGLDPKRRLSNQNSLKQLGMDSLMAIDLKTWITKDLGVNLDIENLISAASISQLGDQLYERLVLAKVVHSPSPTDYHDSLEVVRI